MHANDATHLCEGVPQSGDGRLEILVVVREPPIIAPGRPGDDGVFHFLKQCVRTSVDASVGWAEDLGSEAEEILKCLVRVNDLLVKDGLVTVLKVAMRGRVTADGVALQ